MKLLVTGGSQTAYFVARTGLARGYDVRMIVESRAVGEDFAARLGVVVLTGDPTEARHFEPTGDWIPQVLVALADADHTNLVTCQLARIMQGVERTITRVRDPDYREVFEALGISSVVSSAELLVPLIERESFHDGVRARVTMLGDMLEAVEVQVAEESSLIGRSPGELALPEGAAVAGLKRGDELVGLEGDEAALEAGDVLMVVTPVAHSAHTMERLGLAGSR